jgi:hypothetical protein
MPALTTDYGEQWWADNALGGVTVTVTLYNQSSDGLGEGSDTGDITTEPSGSSYARQSSSVSTTSFGDGTYGYENDSTLTFDTSDSSQTVDHAAFIASVAGADHLVAIAPLNDTRDLSNFSEIKIETGLLTHKAD